MHRIPYNRAGLYHEEGSATIYQRPPVQAVSRSPSGSSIGSDLIVRTLTILNRLVDGLLIGLFFGALRASLAQNLILNAHALGPTLSFQAMESPRHKVQISENVARMFRNESLAELKREPGDEVLFPS